MAGRLPPLKLFRWRDDFFLWGYHKFLPGPRKKPIVLVRTDFRAMEGSAGEYNPMLTQAATIRLDLPAASTTEVVGAVLEALERIRAA